ncbi:aminotransferase class IV family protein [Croceivirga thetidis]|uniref:4-amino-4-deoxychorismate lyase n=1 Tax=Croceivirga thetidis TaxID=2721623 RepID=A0ABX1GUW1_9FLAO|nr:aminotransferase class IV family protein [Croceivirga thetidis]NKI32846.1 hypothetical protein [Croceivirga thetidis]
MFPLFESVCVSNGKIQNADFHQKRFEQSFKKFYWKQPSFELFDEISIPSDFQKGKVKLRISYNETRKNFSFQNYKAKKIERIQLVEHNTIDYELKFEDRAVLNELYEQRGDCDDVLIVKNGNITDTSYANIIFYDGDNWLTPSTPLLKGTKRAQLLKSKLIWEDEILKEDLKSFKGFQLINAMLDFNPRHILPIEAVQH